MRGISDSAELYTLTFPYLTAIISFAEKLTEAIINLIIKHFTELTTEELFEIYKLRTAVFVVEQNCPYQEVDDADKSAYHIWLEDEDGIEAYARALPEGVTFPTASIGRVISVKRRCGLGSKVVKAAIDTVREKFKAEKNHY